MSSALTAGMLR